MSTRLGQIALVLLASACSSDTAENNGDAWQLGDPDGGDAAPSPECSVDSDCGERGEAHCFHPAECGAAAYCKPGYSPCSAAAPFEACGCDGRVGSFAAGCPGDYAWEVGSLGYDLVGTPCDAAAMPPFDVHLTVQITDHPALAEGTIYVKLSAELPGSPEIVELDTSRVAEFQFIADPWAYLGVDVLVDRDGDGRCSIGIDEDFASSELQTDLDLQNFEFRREVSLVEVSDPCARWP